MLLANTLWIWHEDLSEPKHLAMTTLKTHGSEKAIRENGLFCLEGKTYQVKDGDIINVRFNV